VADAGIETELKIPVSDLTAVRTRLTGLEAQLTSENGREINVLLDTEDRQLARRGCLLRLRSYHAARILTFKGPASFDGGVKARPEHEAKCENLEQMHTVLEALGYRRVARYEKDREAWRVGGVEVVLDHTRMGDFVEVEGPSALLGPVTRSLGLDPADAVRGSYMSLWAEFRESHPERALPHDMVFEE
jgi:adenylate cyclase class 2